MPLLPAAAIAALVAGSAWLAGALTPRGGWAAWTVGTAVLWGAGWAGGAVLAAFFVGSSAVSRLVRPRRPGTLDPKGERRDERQVYANGAAAAVGALIGRGDELGLWLVTAGLAAAAADTWATAWGGRSAVPPRHLLTGRVVPPGTSGGVTVIGSLGGLAGAVGVALTGAVAGGTPALLPAGALIGFGGMLADSGIGALLQGRFECPACGVASEWRTHRCGTATIQRGGWRWLDNDGVNALATGLATLAGALAWALVCPCS